MRVRIPPLIGVQIGAVTATILAAAFASSALLSGLDRLVEHDANAAPTATSWAYSRNVLSNAANAAAAEHKWGRANALIARALIADPMNEHVVGALGELRLITGNKAGADAAFRISAQRGWRDPSTHIYWLERSIDVGDFATAALHADALLRGSISGQMHKEIYNTLMEYDSGRDALAARMRKEPPWAPDFVIGVADATPDELIARADVAIRAGSNVFTCSDVAGFINRLIEINAATQATRVFKNSCGRTNDLIHDPDFTVLFQHHPTSAMNWFVPENGQIPPSQNVPFGVSFSSSNDVTQQILAQRLVIAPGTYRLTWDILDTPPNLAKSLLVDLSCSTDIANARAGEPDARDATLRVLQFRVDDRCLIPKLTFWLGTIDGTIKINNVKLERTDRH